MKQVTLDKQGNSSRCVALELLVLEQKKYYNSQ